MNIIIIVAVVVDIFAVVVIKWWKFDCFFGCLMTTLMIILFLLLPLLLLLLLLLLHASVFYASMTYIHFELLTKQKILQKMAKNWKKYPINSYVYCQHNHLNYSNEPCSVMFFISLLPFPLQTIIIHHCYCQCHWLNHLLYFI